MNIDNIKSGTILVCCNPNIDNTVPVFVNYRGPINNLLACVVNLTTGTQFSMPTQWLRPATREEMEKEFAALHAAAFGDSGISSSSRNKYLHATYAMRDALDSLPRLRNDFRPETRSLIRSLRKAGFTIVTGSNGEESFAPEGRGISDKFIEELCACDEAWLTVVSSTGNKYKLYLVFGNSPGELVCDYSMPSDVDEVDAVVGAHAAKWETRKQPTCE